MIRDGEGFRLAFPPIAAILSFLIVGCAGTPYESSEHRRETIQSEIRNLNLNESPSIRAKHAEVNAALEQENDSPVFDEIELRASAIHENDEKLALVARLPVNNPLVSNAQKAVRRAGTDTKVAQLKVADLRYRAGTCAPMVGRLAHAERLRTYDRYVTRQRGMQKRNAELRAAGQLDQISALRFELEGRVSIERKVPAALAPDATLDSIEPPTSLLPSIQADLPALSASPTIVRAQLLANLPKIREFRARGREYDALARKESATRYPSLRFVDLGIEPVAFPGDKRRYDAQIAVKFPFGREATSKERRYRFLSVSQENKERAFIQARVQEALAAIAEVNHFRRRSASLRRLLHDAGEAEKTADGWWQKRLAKPSEVSQLIDEVFDARATVVDARERAGVAGCAILASTGVTVADWPE